MPGNGGLNFFGERHIQSHVPVNGEEPEVSILVAKPSFFNSEVNSSIRKATAWLP